jgi:hypothetical protein
MPTPIPRLPIEDIPQRSATQPTTETLRRALRADDEHLVATRPLAHPQRKILGNFALALALALRGRWFSRWLRWNGGNLAIAQHYQRNPPTISLTLLATKNLATLAGTPGAARPTPPPTLCGHSAWLTAIAAQRMNGPIELLAPLEQAMTTTKMRCRGTSLLYGWNGCGILKWAQGS